MKCKNCGFENMEGANYCIQCGTKLDPEPELELPAVQDETDALVDANPVQTGFILIDPDTAEADPIETEVSETVLEETPHPDQALHLDTDVDHLLTDENQTADTNPSPSSALEEALSDLSEAVSKDPEPESENIGSASDSKDSEDALWYYMDGESSVGPFTTDEIFEKIRAGLIDRHTYMWTRGLPDWIHLSQSPFAQSSTAGTAADFQSTASSGRQADFASRMADSSASRNMFSSTDSQSAVQWFCVQDNRSTGPYSPEVIAQMLSNGTLNGSTYVWREGMSDWEYLKNTELASLLQPSGRNQNASFWGSDSLGSGGYQNGASNPSMNMGYTRPGTAPGVYVQHRSIILYILLSLLTCGIWQLIWEYQVAKDINMLAVAQGKPKGVDPAMAVIFSILTCGIYMIYYFYKEGSTISQLQYPNYRVDNQAVLLAVLGVFIPTASIAILQDQINSIVRYGA